MSATNWSGNLTYSTNPRDIHSIEQLKDHIHTADHVKVIGSRHSFNDIADSSSLLLSLQHLNQIVEIDSEKQTVTVEAGIRYGDLALALNQAGYALHNLASLPHISVVGACATGTHGSGVHNGNLATAVAGLSFITGTGEQVHLNRADNADIFSGLVVNLGALGIVTHITLDIMPTYQVQQNVYVDLPIEQLKQNFDEIMALGYSVSAFTDWQGDTVNQLWIKSKDDAPLALDALDAIPATRNYHPIDDVSPENCTVQQGIWGDWHERLPHFQMAFSPSKGDELQSEYFVDRAVAAQAISALQSIGDIIKPVLLVSEIRCIAADDLWLSPCYQRDSMAFHFTWQQDWNAVRDVLLAIEQALAPFAPRAHLGKLFTMPIADIRASYAKFSDFQQLVQLYDPHGKFQNRYLKALLWD
ncbi:MAG: FAD-binding protein [Phototrophicaceae bacterium]